MFVPPSKQKAVKERLNSLIHVPFKFERLGTQIIFYDDENDYLDEEKIRAKQAIKPFQELDQALV